MSHVDEVCLIRRRSLRMLYRAKECLRDGDYDLAVFLAEQAVQLYIKSVILEVLGEMPRTHVIRQLLHYLRNAIEDNNSIDNFIRHNRMLFSALEEAHLASRYFFKVYSREEAETLVKFAEEVISFVKNLKGKA